MHFSDLNFFPLPVGFRAIFVGMIILIIWQVIWVSSVVLEYNNNILVMKKSTSNDNSCCVENLSQLYQSSNKKPISKSKHKDPNLSASGEVCQY